MTYLFIIFGILFFIAAALLIVLAVVFKMTFASTRKIDVSRLVPNTDQYNPIKDRLLALVDRLDERQYESIKISSHDGLSLFARYFKNEREDVIEIEFHGYRSSSLRDYCGGNELSRNRGFSTLLVDQRSHGKSEGKAIAFGIKERYDVISWIDYAIKRFGKDVKIILSGISMGAATVLMASELNLPENVIAIIADCPYSSPKDIIRLVAKNMGFVPDFIYPFIKLSARLFGGFDIDAASPVNAVKNTNIPIMIIHGDDDRYVPFYMGKQVFEACSSKNKRFEAFHGAGHGLCYFCDTERYERIVKEFTDELLQKNDG